MGPLTKEEIKECGLKEGRNHLRTKYDEVEISNGKLRSRGAHPLTNMCCRLGEIFEKLPEGSTGDKRSLVKISR